MRMQKTISLLAFAAALAACSAEAPKQAGGAAPDPTVTDTPAAPVASPREGPAGEVAPGSREPAGAAGTAQLPEGVDQKWAVYYAHGIPFVFGSEAGQAKAVETGKPMMMFYTATW